MSRGQPARVAPLGPAYDLLAAYRPGGVFMEREGIGVAGGSVPFATLEPRGLDEDPDVLALLRELMPTDGPEGVPGPFAFGSVPFLPGTPGRVQVPARAVRRGPDGRTWSIAIGPDLAEPPDAYDRARGAPQEPFVAPQIHDEPSSSTYEAAVAEAVARIETGTLRKVVLARTIELAAGRRLDASRLVRRLRAVEPHGYVFATPTDEGVLVGASPELLASRTGREVRANPLAGSAPRFGDPAQDAASAERLLASAKDDEEHRIVVDAIADVLGPVCETLAWDPHPVLLETANVWHLSTRFHGTLREPALDALALVRLLHPTPAVCGEPREAALDLIGELEPVPRGSYAGAVGWMDANGDGTWAIALRCAELRGDLARLYAGAGIVADSDPAQELEETDRKFRAFLDALRWG